MKPHHSLIGILVFILSIASLQAKDVILYSDPAQGYQYQFKIHPLMFESDSVRLEQGRSLGLYLVQNPDQKEILKSMAKNETGKPQSPPSTSEVDKAADRFFAQQKKFGDLMGGTVDPTTFKPGISLDDPKTQAEIKDLVTAHFQSMSWLAMKGDSNLKPVEDASQTFEACARSVIDADQRSQAAFIVLSTFSENQKMLQDFDLPINPIDQDKMTSRLFEDIARAGWKDFSQFPCIERMNDPEITKMTRGKFDFLRYRQDISEVSLILKRAASLKGQTRFAYLAIVTLAFSESFETGFLTRALWRRAHLNAIQDNDWRFEIRRIAQLVKAPDGKVVENTQWIDAYIRQLEERIL